MYAETDNIRIIELKRTTYRPQFIIEKYIETIYKKKVKTSKQNMIKLKKKNLCNTFKCGRL